jgi:hypothetical protein
VIDRRGERLGAGCLEVAHLPLESEASRKPAGFALIEHSAIVEQVVVEDGPDQRAFQLAVPVITVIER